MQFLDANVSIQHTNSSLSKLMLYQAGGLSPPSLFGSGGLKAPFPLVPTPLTSTLLVSTIFNEMLQSLCMQHVLCCTIYGSSRSDLYSRFVYT